MKSFGQLLRHYRRYGSDPLRGGLLTQARLGELIGDELGHTGYSGAAVSDWERDKSKIHADDRLVLLALISTLYRCGGLPSLAEASELLTVGNYRALDEAELSKLFPDQTAEIHPATPALGAGHPLSQTRRKQLVLLDKVEHFWVKGVLQRVVAEALLLDIAWQRLDTAVAHPWQDVLDTAVNQLPRQSILDTFLDADRALLILGAPGSGKSITLITLARDLITRARFDETQPVPVILNLASWAEKREPLAAWIVEELTDKYQIPRTIGQQWLEDDELILLLDGLDELPRRHQAGCIQSINQFRQIHGLAGVVVCSRQDDYEALDIRLKLSGAILLQLLSPVQIEAYLAAVGSSLGAPGGHGASSGRAAHNAILWEMAQSPLILRVMSETQMAETAVGLAANDDAPYQHLFDTYIQQMFTRRGPLRHGPEKTKAWLAWLANQMNLHHQTIFLVEHIQPSWLPTRHCRRAFILTSRLIDGISLGFVIWMFWLLVRLALAGFETIWSEAVTHALPIPTPLLSLLLFLLLFLFLGLLAGAVDIIFYERRAHSGETHTLPPRDEWQQTVVVALVVSLASCLTIGLYRDLLVGLASTLFTGFSFALTTHFIHGHSYRNDIRPVEALNWSWRGALIGVPIGLVAAAVFEMVEYLAVGPTPIFRTVVSITLLFTLLAGLRGGQLPTSTTPNQGIWLSAANALAAAGLFAVVMGVVTAVFWDVTFGVLAGILAGWIAAALYGAGTVLNYLWLRLWLVWIGDMPLRMVTFLNEAANRALLHKIGGGYIFIHRLLQEHFAAMLEEP